MGKLEFPVMTVNAWIEGGSTLSGRVLSDCVPLMLSEGGVEMEV